MRKGVLYSTALHAAVIAVAWFGVPSLFRPPPVVAPPIAVELVMDQPPEKPKAKPSAPKPRPPRAKAPPAAPPPAPDIPPPPQTALAMPEPAAEPPPPPKAKPKPKEKAKPKPAVPKKVAAPQPRPRPKPPPRKTQPEPKPKPKPDELQALLKNLAQQKAARAHEQQQAALPEKPALPRPVPTPRRSALETRQLENILIQAVRQQLEPCWNVPAGAKDAEEMRVGIRIRLSPDGTLRGAPAILDTSRIATDPFYRAVAESAVRALLNPECRPLRLPLDQYDIWKEITFNFDPGEALGR